MKRFDFKKLLLLVLALVLVFALAACKPVTPPVEDGGDDVVPLTATDYFTALWDSSKSIGSTAIGNEDMRFDIGLEIDLVVGTKTTPAITYKLGVDIAAIYDRAGTDVGKYSAAMVKITDRTKTTNSNLLSLYYFLDEPTNIYANLYDQEIKLQFNADNAEGAAANNQIVANLTDFLTKKEVGKDSIDDIILRFTNTFGADFDLDDILAVLLEMLGMSKDDLIATVEGIVGELDVKGENPRLLDLLNAFGGIALTNVKKTEIASGFTWSASLKPAMISLLNGFTDGLFGGNTTVGLTFDTNTAGTDLDNFTILINRPAVLGDKGFNAKIKITNLEAVAVTAAASGTGSVFGMNKANYKEDYKIGINAVVSVDEAMLKLSYNDETAAKDADKFSAISALYTDDIITIAPLNEFEIKGEFIIEATGHANLMKNDSKTAAYAKISYKENASATAVTVVEANFVNVAGVGTAKIWVDDTNIYASVARDYLILNLVRSLHKSNVLVNPVDPANPTRAELLAGSNGAVIASLLGALTETHKSNFIITGIELQQMLYDLCFLPDEKVATESSVMDVFTAVDYVKVATLIDGYTYDEVNNVYFKGEGVDRDEKTKADLYKLAKVPASLYPFDVDILSIVKIAFGMVSQDTTNAFAVATANGIAETLLKQNVDNTIIAQLGFFNTLYKKSGSGTTYDSFSNQEEFYSWIYKGNQGVINRMTVAGIIPAIKLVPNTSGKYVYNDKFELVEWTNKLTGQRYNLVKASTLAENALVGNGTWFYQNSSTVSKDEAMLMWNIAVGKTEVTNMIGTPLEEPARAALYSECFEEPLLELLKGSSFLGEVEVGNEDAWLDNLLSGNLTASISYVTEDGLTINVGYTDKANKKLNVSLTLSIEAIDAPYTVPASTNLSFTALDTDVCVIDVASYMP